MSPKELIQLLTVAAAQIEADPLLRKYRPDSPAIIGTTMSLIDSLPLLLESAYAEAQHLKDLDEETERHQRLINRLVLIGA